MQIQTFSVVVGTRACNAKCPFCVSRMTGFDELPGNREINRRNLRKAMALAKLGGSTTVLITGKGEPTLYPGEISEYLELFANSFPFIELQTNGLELGWLARDGEGKAKKLNVDTLRNWHALGLNTIALSVVDIDSKKNAQVYNADYPELSETAEFLHGLGFSLRLCVMAQNGCVDTPQRLEEVLDFCKRTKIEQLTLRPLRKPEAATQNDAASQYVADHGVDGAVFSKMTNWVRDKGTRLMRLMHGAEIYDVAGQNICLSDCLTVDSREDDIRTLIFYGDGRLTYDWQYEGAVLLGGDLD